MRKLTIILLLNLYTLVAIGQDTTSTKSKEGYKDWTQTRSCLRLGIGAQKSFFSEIGFARLSYIYNDLGYASAAYYAALEWTPTILPDKPRNVYGLKAGYEMNLRALAVGIEVKYQTDRKENDFVLTPKVGFGVIGVVNIFYGYNISFMSSPFDKIGHNQFSIVFNLNRHIMSVSKH